MGMHFGVLATKGSVEKSTPGSEKLKPVVARRSEGFDLVAPGTRMPDGSRVGEKGKPGLLGRLLGRG